MIIMGDDRAGFILIKVINKLLVVAFIVLSLNFWKRIRFCVYFVILFFKILLYFLILYQELFLVYKMEKSWITCHRLSAEYIVSVDMSWILQLKILIMVIL